MHSAKRILILGGTAEARDIAAALLVRGHHVTSSLAGVTKAPLLPQGELRVGGFGGTQGLIAYLRSAKVQVLVDATHPFAAIMSAHAHEAAGIIEIPLLRFERPAWQPQIGDNWISVTSMAEAATVVPQNAQLMITTGRKGLDGFLQRIDLSGVIRSIEPPDEVFPSRWQLLLDRPPYDEPSETQLMKNHGITHLVTKNAGGGSTSGKLAAARQLGLPVVVIKRPVKPTCRRFAVIDHLVLAVEE